MERRPDDGVKPGQVIKNMNCIEHLTDQARKARRLARHETSPRVVHDLEHYARDCEAEADRMRRQHGLKPTHDPRC